MKVKESDAIRLKRTIWSQGIAIPTGSTGRIVTVHNGNTPMAVEAEILNADGQTKSLVTLLAEDYIPATHAEIHCNNPFSVVSVSALEKLADDVRCNVHVIITNPEAGATFVSNNQVWFLASDIKQFIKDLAVLGNGDANKAVISSASPEEFHLELWQRKSLPIVRVHVGHSKHMQNQNHRDGLSGSFEMDSALDKVIAGFKSLLD